MNYLEYSYEEQQLYKHNLLKEIEIGDALDRLLDNEDFNKVFNEDRINERILDIQEQLVHTDESKGKALNELMFYAYFKKYINNLQTKANYARDDLAGIKQLELEESRGL